MMGRILILSLTLCLLVFSGCAAQIPAHSSSVAQTPPQESQAQSVDAGHAKGEAAGQANPYYNRVRSYLEDSLEQSVLVTIDKDGRVVRSLPFPGEAYVLCDVSPDGKTLLMQGEPESGGEARAAYYLTIDALTGELLGQTNEKQWGYAPHVLLDDNLIGFGSGSVIGGQEDTWQPIKLFDAAYNPLTVKLDFDYGEMRSKDGMEYRENQIVGIGYDADLKQYMVAFAKDASAPDQPAFSVNRLGITFFDASGKWISNFMPEGYQSPFSENLIMVRDNYPVLCGGSIVLNAVEPGRETAMEESAVVCFDKASAMQNTLSVAGNYPTSQFSVVRDGKDEYLFLQEGEQHPLTSKLLLWDDKGVKERPLPSAFEVEGFSEPFYLSDVCRSGGNTYAAAQTYTETQTGSVSFTGIFAMNGETPALLQLIPAQYPPVLAPAENGSVTFSVSGIGVERESNMNYQDLRDRTLAESELLEQLAQLPLA